MRFSSESKLSASALSWMALRRILVPSDSDDPDARPSPRPTATGMSSPPPDEGNDDDRIRSAFRQLCERGTLSNFSGPAADLVRNATNVAAGRVVDGDASENGGAQERDLLAQVHVALPLLDELCCVGDRSRRVFSAASPLVDGLARAAYLYEGSRGTTPPRELVLGKGVEGGGAEVDVAARGELALVAMQTVVIKKILKLIF